MPRQEQGRDGRAQRRSGARLIGAFLRAEGAATAVEFGMLALPFIMLMAAILEIALVFWSTQVLETATANAARQIYTGQFQSNSAYSTYTPAQMAAQFKTNLCASVSALFDCTGGVYVDVRNVTDYSTASVPATIVSGTFNAGAFGYQNVAGGKIALITAAIEYPLYFKAFAFAATPGLTSGNRILVATAIFQTEPFTP